jgi:hypothetical protein
MEYCHGICFSKGLFTVPSSQVEETIERGPEYERLLDALVTQAQLLSLRGEVAMDRSDLPGTHLPRFVENVPVTNCTLLIFNQSATNYCGTP